MIRNTATAPAFDHLFTAMEKGGIERQEAQGQRQLAASSQLPADGLTPQTAEQRGITVLGPTEGDPLFLRVTLPDGWKIEPTDHSMWSKLVDADGVEQASIFYKAAFYDRSAFIRWA